MHSHQFKSLPAGTRVVCAVPNTPVSVGCGATVCSFGTHVTTEDKELVQSLFRTTGLCEALPEQYLDIVTGLSGSGPAYVSICYVLFLKISSVYLKTFTSLTWLLCLTVNNPVTS